MRGRPSLDIGAHGEFWYETLPSGAIMARCNSRDLDGRTRRVSASGSSKSAARAALQAKLQKRHVDGVTDITPDTRIGELAQVWHKGLSVSAGSKDSYQASIDRHIVPKIGSVRVREVTTPLIEAFLSRVSIQGTREVVTSDNRRLTVRDGGVTAARQCRVVLTGMLTLAVKRGAIRVNPIREASTPKRTKSEVRALTDEMLHDLRRDLATWQKAGRRDRAPDLLDQFDLFLGTGARPGELLAFLWKDAELLNGANLIKVTGTIKRTSEKGLHRQEAPKSRTSERSLLLPQFAVSMLLRRRLAQPPNPLGLIFATKTGNVIEPNNFNRMWRLARGEKWDWVTPKAIRKSVATIIEREMGMAAASAQLGHSSEEITRRFYVERQTLGPDATELLERTAGRVRPLA